jgi:hypothetical protein
MKRRIYSAVNIALLSASSLGMMSVQDQEEVQHSETNSTAVMFLRRQLIARPHTNFHKIVETFTIRHNTSYKFVPLFTKIKNSSRRHSDVEHIDSRWLNQRLRKKH